MKQGIKVFVLLVSKNFWPILAIIGLLAFAASTAINNQPASEELDTHEAFYYGVYITCYDYVSWQYGIPQRTYTESVHRTCLRYTYSMALHYGYDQFPDEYPPQWSDMYADLYKNTHEAPETPENPVPSRGDAPAKE